MTIGLDSLEIIGAAKDGGCATYGTVKLQGAKLYSDDEIALIIDQAEARGSERAQKQFEKAAKSALTKAERIGYQRGHAAAMEKMNKTLGSIKEPRILNKTKGVSKYAPE